jgi:putative ABC transport system ATP-binding protein
MVTQLVDPHPTSGVDQPLIRARSVAKRYRLGEQTVQALDGVSFVIERGEFVAIMGPSGSGKSTMMNLIGALDVPSQGALEIGGRDIAGLTSDELADLRSHMIGFVFQQFNLMPRTTAYQNVMLPLTYARPRPGDADERVRKRLAEVELSQRMNHHPSQLSGGQQQRVAIARALVNAPQILLADEPTGALDSVTSEEIMKLFVRLNRENGITVVVVTHEAEVAAYAQRRIVFRDGHIVEDERQSAANESALA